MNFPRTTPGMLRRALTLCYIRANGSKDCSRTQLGEA
jgi:hypothetical protein